MNKKHILLIRTALALCIMLTASVLMAQPGGGGGQGNGGSPPPAGAPIDGGAVMLLSSIAGYAFRKLRTAPAEAK